MVSDETDSADPDATDGLSEHPAERQPGAISRTDPDSYTLGDAIVLIGAVGIAFSALLPWVSVEVLEFSTVATGTDVAGVFTLPIGGLVVGSVLYSPGVWTRRKFSAVIVLSVVSGLVALVYLLDPVTAVDVPQGVSEDTVSPFVNVEIGVYSTLLGSVGGVIGSALGRYS